ncbi:hypothetical protein RO3G_06090 [Lichtheimia corymbifera JMRC:FSU:9682]|uniref:Integrase zinc-binding domain-containing protein n=1 Tax=Lichtheimia corymbifera JMRC:FSU:9682 TaxID=1263082 RepID=A0A068SB98_9FUNG|nr:hypothetical protein RO3G_06090 [Lichtheimia corymbifera JMRC:FSU:9682]
MKSPLQSSSLFTAAAAAAYGFEGRRFFPQQLTPPEESFDDENQLPTPEEFDKIVNDYLNNLSPKKKDKALVDQKRYQVIQQVLKDPRNTAISTAQFRFWVKKMFQLQPGTVGLVCHDGKPVAMKEQIYSILVQAHREAQHGGRDKTSALVRRKFSWIPKELVARFVRHCPFCITRRNGGQSPGVFTQQHKMHKPNQCINNTPRHSFDASFLCTPSMYEDSDFSSTTENGYGASPTSYAYSSSTSPARRDSTSIYDKEEEDFLQAYARNGGFHPFITHPNATAAAAAAAVAAVASTSTTPFSTTSTTRTPNSGAPTLFDDHTSSPTSQNIFYQASTGYLGYPSYYYPNVLGIVPCDNTPTGIDNHHQPPPPPPAVDSTVTTDSHPSTEDTTADILAHHHRHSQHQQQHQQPLPPTTPSNNNFMTYPNDDTNSSNHVLL